MNSPQATTPVSPGLWTHAQQCGADWLAACPQDAFSQFANQYRLVEQVTDSAGQVLALTICAIAATRGRAADAVSPAEIRQVLNERDTPRTLIEFWSGPLRLGNLPCDVRHELTSALNWASRPYWDDTLSINGPGIAPFPASDGPPVVRAVLEQMAPPA